MATLPLLECDTRKGDSMGKLQCLLFGHKKAGVVFSSSRFYCTRCGIDLGVEGALRPVPQPSPMSKTAARQGTKRSPLR
jgi:hypothetical protein